MIRNLDLTALRSFVAVADAGGVTRAAGLVNLTQSAVSMQLKRLEEGLGLSLIDRSQRTAALTAEGEQLLGYARRMLELNDEAWARLTHPAFEGEINVGVPQDIMYPHIPRVLQRFAQEYPRVRVNLLSDYTAELKPRFGRGELDLILTTEGDLDAHGETLAREPLVWVGAIGGQAWRGRPLRFGSSTRCVFRRPAIAAMDAAELPWVLAIDSVSCATVEVSVSADLAVCVFLASSVPATCEEIPHGGALPDLPDYRINLYVGEGPRAALADRLGNLLRQAYGCTSRLAAE